MSFDLDLDFDTSFNSAISRKRKCETVVSIESDEDNGSDVTEPVGDEERAELETDISRSFPANSSTSLWKTRDYDCLKRNSDDNDRCIADEECHIESIVLKEKPPDKIKDIIFPSSSSQHLLREETNEKYADADTRLKKILDCSDADSDIKIHEVIKSSVGVKKNKASVKRPTQKQKSKEGPQVPKKISKTAEDKTKKSKVKESQATNRPNLMKEVVTCVNSAVLNEYPSLTDKLNFQAVPFEIMDDPDASCDVIFKRETVFVTVDSELKPQRICQFSYEDQAIVIIKALKLVSMIENQISSEGSSNEILSTSQSSLTLNFWIRSIQFKCDKKLTLFITGMEDYYKKLKRKDHQNFRKKVLSNGIEAPTKAQRKKKPELPNISPSQIQCCLIEMQIHLNVNYRFVKDEADLAFFLKQYSGSVAEAPFKKEKMESQGFDWGALANNTGTIKVDKDGQQLLELWISQLQEFSNVGIEAARAIAYQYPSPRALFQAFSKCSDQKTGEELLASLSVRKGTGPLATTRKLGPDISKKLYRFFSASKGNRFLSSSVDI